MNDFNEYQEPANISGNDQELQGGQSEMLEGVESAGMTGDDTGRKSQPSAMDIVPESPEMYDFGLETLDMEIDAELERSFRSKAHELGLTQKQAGELVQLYAEHQGYAHVAQQERLTGTLIEAENSWISEMMRDRNFNQDVSRARAAVQAYGNEEFMQILDQTRLGSHPAFVRFMARVGQDLAEPAFQRAQFALAERSPAEVLYPNQGR